MKVEIEDFGKRLAEMNAALSIDPASTAVVTVDIQSLSRRSARACSAMGAECLFD